MRREHILDFVYNEFAVNGIKRVSVDDLASKMRISKKTLYELFSNKENLVIESIKNKCGKIIVALAAISGSCPDVLRIIIRCSMELFNSVQAASPQFLEEIRQCEVAKEYLRSVKEELLVSGRVRFEQGRADGLLRDDADFEIVGHLLNSQVVEAYEHRDGKYHPNKICFNALIIILRGVCTDKGRAILDDIQSEYEDWK